MFLYVYDTVTELPAYMCGGLEHGRFVSRMKHVVAMHSLVLDCLGLETCVSQRDPS